MTPPPDLSSLSLAEIARKRADGLTAEGSFKTDHMNYPFGIHAIVARVDPDTCGVHVERFVIAFDIGRMINPMLVEGQLAGGAAQEVELGRDVAGDEKQSVAHLLKLEEIGAKPDELISWKWCDHDEVAERVHEFMARRLDAALLALATGSVAELENGFPVK